ncbi:6-pyruvoyl tetrahydropterin synthase [Vibrio phage vB_VpaS_AL-2]|nr:6-pyruvoyl tetrahydropterin synthase [Vibrio phage vB_VpaS_AL-2]
MGKPLMKQTAIRYHDFCMGHRVVGHEGKCRHLHGHNYRIHFHCEAAHLDEVGRVIDFSVIKQLLCEWIEDHWDHKFMAWLDDPIMRPIAEEAHGIILQDHDIVDMQNSFVFVDFNPTAENIAAYFLDHIGPKLLFGTGVQLTKVVLEETRKCSVECSLG